MTKAYIGLASEGVTPFETRLMEEIGFFLALKGYLQRTRSFDRSFENGLSEFIKETKLSDKKTVKAEVFGGVSGNYVIPNFDIIDIQLDVWQKAQNTAKKYLPLWESLSTKEETLYTLNTFLVYGQKLDNTSKLVIYRNPNLLAPRTLSESLVSHAIKMATAERIPSYNIADRRIADKILEKINSDYLAAI
jgi:hypothetical protein